MFKLSLTMTLRDWRAGELRFLVGALALAVAALTAVQFFTDRMGSGLRRDVHQLLGADLVVNGDAPINPAWRAEAVRRGLRVADTVELPSMAIAGEGTSAVSQLVSVKAVSAGYPLRGALKLGGGAAAARTDAIPGAGLAWVDPAVLAHLKLSAGAPLRLGDASLRVGAVIASEPDRGATLITFTPRVMLGMDELSRTGLLQAGSFADHKLLVAGEPAAVLAYQTWLKAADPKARIDTLASSAASVAEALGRAERFLSLVGLISSLLASVAVAMAARRFTLRHADASAMLRCLGLTQGRVTAMYLIEFLLVGLAGGALGVLCGYASHFVLLEWLGSLVTSELAAAGWAPVASGLALAIVLLVGFGLPPLLQLRNVSHNRLLRREALPPRAATMLSYVLGLGVFGALLMWQAGDLEVGLLTAGAFVLSLAVFVLVAWAAVAALRLLPDGFGNGVWRLALGDMRRRSAATVTQVVALALGLMALLLLTVVRGDLLAAWKDSAPPGTPNHIIFKIQPEQRDALTERLRPYGQPQLVARIPARVVAINDARVDPAKFVERAKWMLEREIDISASAAVPAGSTLVAGRWFGPAGGAAEVSVSEPVAKDLKLKLGDRIGFEIAGQALQAKITSLRKIEKQTRRPPFAFVIDPAHAAGLSASYLVSVHVPVADTGFGTRLALEFPNLTVLNTGAMIAMVQRVLDQVSAAVEFLFLFTLASGVLVLYATLAASQDERMRQAALLRALGASRAQLSQAQWIEYTLIGALAGVLAAAGASAASWALAKFAFKLAWQFSPQLWAIGLLAGAACAVIGGWAGLRAVLNHPPLHTLRT